MRVKNDVKVIYILFGIVLTYFSIYMPDFMNVAGMEGTKISSIVSFGALNGMLFGPFWGSIVSAAGFLLYEVTSGKYLSMSMFSVLSILFIALSSIVSGLVVNREHKAAKSIFFALIVVWYMLDVGRTAYSYPWYHLLVLGIFIYFEKSILVKTVTSKAYIFISLFLASLMGVLSDHMAGSITYYLLYDLHADMYQSVVLLYPVERTILAFFPAFLVYVLIVVFKDIILSSGNIEKDIEDKKSRDLDEYLQNDVLNIIKEQ
ncbi:hypothetical protein RE476_11840 [Methanolobus mangrovi]|uniref:ECF transporter S component n=1 Tax=Methanolobus mangrovi TaxID=3072977 RepID=A0AA51UF30_9EURY|nr:hypothetical protein [Methanolobus mangrovi]WMW22049.1 hypothetical protein RE476_11840 [Methanolobus mangrovi]